MNKGAVADEMLYAWLLHVAMKRYFHGAAQFLDITNTVSLSRPEAQAVFDHPLQCFRNVECALQDRYCSAVGSGRQKKGGSKKSVVEQSVASNLM